MVLQTLVGITWSTPLRKTITSVLTGITLVAGTITSVNSAWPVVEPVVPAHRLYVRTIIQNNDVLPAVRDLQLENAEGKRDIADFEILRLQLELTKPHTDDDKLKIQQEIIKRQNTKAKLIDQINTLKKLRDKFD